MSPDLWSLYPSMLRCRLYEKAIDRLWNDGLISGEMHLGTGEEAIVAGAVSQLRAGDAMALDHRGTAALLVRGVDPVLILRELLGRTDGLCGGMGGHMHLYAKEHLAASSGIVGAAGPAAAGFGLAAQALRPGAIALSFFGEGAMNQGMLAESLNLAVVWKLPVLFICKDDGWSIVTRSGSMTAGHLDERVRAMGMLVAPVDGCDVAVVWQAAEVAIARARSGEGPTFLHARCVHLDGHFSGFQLLRMVRHPLREMPEVAVPLTRSFLTPGGAPLAERLAGLKAVLALVLEALRDPRRDPANDPVARARQSLRPDRARLRELEDGIEKEIGDIIESALAEVSS